MTLESPKPRSLFRREISVAVIDPNNKIAEKLASGLDQKAISLVSLPDFKNAGQSSIDIIVVPDQHNDTDPIDVGNLLREGKHMVLGHPKLAAENLEDLISAAKMADRDLPPRDLGLNAALNGGLGSSQLRSRGVFQSLARTPDIILLNAVGGTTNSILVRMEQALKARVPLSYEEAAKIAVNYEFINGNRQDEVNGRNDVYRLALQASYAYDTPIKPDRVFHQTPEGLTSEDFIFADDASKAGSTIRYIQTASYNNGLVLATEPLMMDKKSYLARVAGSNSAIYYKTAGYKERLHSGIDLGEESWLDAISKDISHIALNIRTGRTGSTLPQFAEQIDILDPIKAETTGYFKIHYLDFGPGTFARLIFNPLTELGLNFDGIFPIVKGQHRSDGAEHNVDMLTMDPLTREQVEWATSSIGAQDSYANYASKPLFDQPQFVKIQK